MLETHALRRRSWAGAAWIIALVSLALAVLLQGYAGALLIALAAAAAATWLLLSADHAPAAPRRVTARGAWVPVAQRIVYTSAGVARPALTVPAEGVEGYQAVLTSDGYVLIDEAGRIVYTLKS